MPFFHLILVLWYSCLQIFNITKIVCKYHIGIAVIQDSIIPGFLQAYNELICIITRLVALYISILVLAIVLVSTSVHHYVKTDGIEDRIDAMEKDQIDRLAQRISGLELQNKAMSQSLANLLSQMSKMEKSINVLSENIQRVGEKQVPT